MSFLSHEQELNTVNILNSTINEIIKDPNFREGTAWIRRQFISNEIIIRQGDISKSFFLIEEGVLRESIHVDIEERRNIQAGISDLIKGDFFGEISLFFKAFLYHCNHFS